MSLFIIVGSVGLVLFLISMFGFGGDHEVGHDGDFSHDGDAGHDGSDSVSLFSYRVIVTFLAAFGAAGAIARYYSCGMLLSAVIGVICGVLVALFAWWLINLAFKQQASSLVTNEDLIDKIAMVITPISGNVLGEVSVEVKGQRQSYHAKAKDGRDIPENASVKIIENHGVFLIVEPVNQTNQQTVSNGK